MFFINDTATTEIYTYGHTLSLNDALPIWPVDDAIEVMPPQGREPGVEALGHGHDVEHANPFAGHRKMGIEGVAQLVGRPVSRQVDMSDLSEGMDAGIGPARPLDGNGLGRQREDRTLQRRLHGMEIGRASCRERGVPYVSNSGGAVT